MMDSLSPTPSSQSSAERYLGLVDAIVDTTLKGKIRSKEQVYQMLVQGVELGTGEIFERCLGDRLTGTQRQIDTQTDEFKLAKANRILRALQTIQGEWKRWQEQNQATELLGSTVQQLVAADPARRLTLFLQAVDPNQSQVIALAQWPLLAKTLQRSPDAAAQPFAVGILRAIESWKQLEDHLVSWIYDQNRSQLGFEGIPGQRGPWALWQKQVTRPLLRDLFQHLALEQSPVQWSAQQTHLETSAWVELALTLQCLQQGLVTWFDRLVYDSQVGAKLSISTFLTFAIVWAKLASGFDQVATGTATLDRATTAAFASGSFQMTLQILRIFAQQTYFPLYGGIFASFSGSYLRDALGYLDIPLRQTEGTQEKARILTLLGYSLRAQGQYQQSQTFHQQALEVARTAGDRPCEVANLNHLSRICVAQKTYGEAINYSQRALILSRQLGDRLGEANALANLGFSEVFQAQQQEYTEPDVYEAAIDLLQQGLKLSERLGDRQSQSLCLSSLGTAHLLLEQPQVALAYLEGAIQTAQFSGDLYLQGWNLSSLAEAQYRLQNFPAAIYAGCLGMYLLEQIASASWRQPAGLLLILQGQVGEEAFQRLMEQHRQQIIATIGVDGYDHLPHLLEQYRG